MAPIAPNCALTTRVHPLNPANCPGCDGRQDFGRPHPVQPHLEPEFPTMATITFIAFDGTKYVVEAQNGSTVMENAIRNSVPGIEAECGGACACATCHVYVDDEWCATVGGPLVMEEDMLDFAYEVQPGSRLSCQIKVSDALDGLVVRVPERQG